MRFTPKQLQVLRAIQLSAESSAEMVSAKAGLTARHVQETLRILREADLLSLRTLVNFSLLGLTEYELLLKFREERPARERLLEWAEQSQCAITLAELGGDSDFEITFLSRGPADVARLLAGLQKACGPHAVERSLLTRLATWLFGTKCLGDGVQPSSPLGWQARTSEGTLDPSDARILAAIQGEPALNVQRIARALAMPASTLQYRLTALEKRGVITGYYYDYSRLLAELGLNAYQLLIRLRVHDEVFQKKFYSFSAAHPLIDKLFMTVGAWDYKLLVRAAHQEAVAGLCDTLRSSFTREIAELRVVPFLRMYAVKPFAALLKS